MLLYTRYQTTETPLNNPNLPIMASSSRPWVSNSIAHAILTYVHYASPILLLIFFLVAFTAHSIVTAPKDEIIQADPNQTGPGGKPLPRNTSPSAKREKEKQKDQDFSPGRKLLFDWLSVAVLLTFLGNAVIVIVHALLGRKHEWWCGQSVIVREILLALIQRRDTGLT